MEQTKTNNGQNILIIDSNKDLQYKIKDCVKNNNIQEKYNLNFIFADDVASALKSIKEQKIDLIVLEIVLSAINGFYFLKAIEQQKEIPIIIYTKLRDAEDLKKISEKGNIINFFIKQLTTPDRLIEKIIKKDNKKDQLDKVINEISEKIKSLNDDKTEAALKILQCPKCHIILANNSHFCNNCGQKIINQNEPSK